MSLINDALKRASSPKPTPAPPPGGPPMQPVESESDRSNPLPIILCIVGIGALLMSAAFWLKSRGNASGTQDLALQKQVERAAAPLPEIESKPIIQNPVEHAALTLPKVLERSAEPVAVPPTNVVAPVVASAPVVPTPAPTPEPVKTEPAPPPAPTFRLQAIYFRMKSPTVVINGKTLAIGDEVNGARLVRIERSAAEIEYRGVREKLTMH